MRIDILDGEPLKRGRFPAAERGPPVGVDQIYESALPLSLQLIVAD